MVEFDKKTKKKEKKNFLYSMYSIIQIVCSQKN